MQIFATERISFHACSIIRTLSTLQTLKPAVLSLRFPPRGHEHSGYEHSGHEHRGYKTGHTTSALSINPTENKYGTEDGMQR